MAQFIPTAECMRQDETSMLLRARIDSELGAFKGHFPEFAVFPGVAQIAILKEIITQHFASLGHMCRIEQLRFQNFVLPEQEIFIFMERTENSVNFKITNAMQQMVASGRMFFKN